MAEAAALLLGESDDSFSFASMPRAKKAEPTVADKSSPRGRSRIEDILSTGSTDRMKTPDDNLETTRGEGEGSAPTALGSGRRDSTRPATANAGDVQPGSETSFRGLASTSSVGRTPSGGTNQSAHVDSADGVDEADELLRMTDPDVLARISTDRSTAAAGGIPAASAEDTRQGVSRRSRFTALSSPITDSAGTGTDSWGNPTGGPRRRSPSPPSHARTQQSASPEGSPRRVLLSHSVAVAGRGESTSTIDKTTEEPGSGRSYESGDTVDGGQANGDRSEVGGHRYGTSEKHKMSIESAAEDSKFTSRSLGDGEERYSHSAPGIGGAANPTTSTTGTLPLRSALANRDKARKCVNKTHGVSFDDDLGNVDALDILPGSDDDAPASPAADVPGFGESSSPASLDVTPSSFPSTVTPRPSAKDETSSGGVDNNNDRRIATEEAERLKDNVDHFPTFAIQSTTRTSGTTMNRSAQRSTSITAGLSRAAARLVTQSSSSDDEQDLVFSQKTDIDSRLGLGPLAAPEKNAKGVARTPAVAADGSDDDDAKLDLVLGFTPSAMDGGRRQRRALSVGGRRRPRADSSLTPEDNRRETPTFTAQRSALASTALASAAAAAGEKEKVTVVSEPVCAPEQAEKSKLDRVDSLALPESASQSPKTLSNKVGPNTEVLTDGAAQQIKLDKTTTGAAEVPRTLKVTDGSGGGGTASAMAGDGKGRTDVGCYSTRSERHTAVGAESVHSSVLSSFERQLVLLTNEKENATTRFAKQEEKLEQEAAASKAAAAAAEARAADADSALAAAR